VVIRESTGRDVRIPKSNLEELAASKVSLMPDNVVAHLNYDQFLDLLAFLKNKREQESLRGAVLEWSVSAGHPLDLKSTAPFESSADPATTGTWVPAAGGSNGLSLREFGEAGIYASFAVQSNARQQVSLVLTSDDPVRVWAGGKLIFERTKPVAGGYGGSESIPLALNEGWTNVLIKVLPVGPKKVIQAKLSGEGVRAAAREEK
jgi:hypothetical protein